jgi:hypothetical protein
MHVLSLDQSPKSPFAPRKCVRSIDFACSPKSCSSLQSPERADIIQHAFRFRVEMEIVDVQTGEIVETETINRGEKFFGKYWGRWLNRYSSQTTAGTTKALESNL